jgi:uncharacterized protein (DUF1330 family)
MSTTLKYTIAALGGAMVGGFAIHGQQAQTKPPVFQVTLQDVSDPAALLKEFVPAARATIAKAGGKVLAGSAPTMLDGKPPAKRVVINMWPSMEVAKAWYASPEYQKAREAGNKYAKFRVMLVEGVAAK